MSNNNLSVQQILNACYDDTIGALKFSGTVSGFLVATNSGMVSLFDMAVTAAAAAGTEESFNFALDASMILKLYAESDGAGGIQNKCVQFGGNTGIVKQFVYQNQTIADDGTVNLPNATDGIAIVSCNAECGIWQVQADGTSTKLVGTANTDNADTDNKLDVYDGGTYGIVKNRLGATGKLRIVYFYY